jgi:hypothetical protein
MYPSEVSSALNSFDPISLEDMESLKLMNRMDTKYVFPAGMLPLLLRALKPGYKVLEINDKRAFGYDTRYLDTEDMLFYYQHVTGKLARHKIRFRKYESTGTTFLEIKRKTNRNRTVKWRIKNISEPGFLDDTASHFIRKHVAINSFTLQPVLNNSFTRVTLAGLDTMERITFDFDMSFTTTDGGRAELPYLAVAELKSEGFPSRSPFVDSAKSLGIKSTGFSKYCIGNALLRDLPKKNILKQNILLINKIKYEYSRFYGS